MSRLPSPVEFLVTSQPPDPPPLVTLPDAASTLSVSLTDPPTSSIPVFSPPLAPHFLGPPIIPVSRSCHRPRSPRTSTCEARSRRSWLVCPHPPLSATLEARASTLRQLRLPRPLPTLYSASLHSMSLLFCEYTGKPAGNEYPSIAGTSMVSYP